MCDCLILRNLACCGHVCSFQSQSQCELRSWHATQRQKTGKSSIRCEPIRLERERRSGRSIHRHIRRKDRRQRRQTLLSDRRPIKPAVPPRMLLLAGSPYPHLHSPLPSVPTIEPLHTHPPRAAHTMPQYQQRLPPRWTNCAYQHCALTAAAAATQHRPDKLR